jgi:hypothetical protein
MNKTTIVLGLSALVIGVAVFAPKIALAYRGDAAVKGPNHTEAKEQAIESANLPAFKAACTTGRMCDVVDTQAELNTLRQMHEANEKGDVKKATELRTSLGLGLRNGSGQGKGMGMGSGMR